MNRLSLFVVTFVLLLSQIIGGRIARSPIIPGYVCPLEDIAGGCRGPKDCLYPNPNDCSSFIQCNDAGIAYEMPCSVGLEWNDDKKECDYPDQSTCNKSPTTSAPTTTTAATTEPPTTEAPTTEQPTTETPTTEPPTTQTAEPDTTTTTLPPSTPTTTSEPPSTEFVCPVEDIIETKCKGPKDCLYPNPANCESFIQCTVDFGEVSGTPIVMPCPAGLQWNDDDKICDWPENSTCDQGQTRTDRK